MATLQRIRNHSVALLVIVGLAMAAFIIGDLLTSSSSIMNSNRDKVVTVNGKKVTTEEFGLRQKRKEEFLKTMMGQDINGDAAHQITQQVYNEFVSRELLNEVNDRLALGVTKGELNDLILGDHTSTVLQQYFGPQAKQVAMFFAQHIEADDFDQIEQQIPYATYGNWMEIEEQVKLYRQMEKLNALVGAAVQPNKLEAKDHFDGDNEQATFAYVRQQAFTVADSLVKVSSADIQAYYDATKRRYRTPESRTIQYIAVPLRPSQADLDEARQELENARQEFTTSDDIADLVNSNSAVPFVDAYMPLNAFTGDILSLVQSDEPNAVMPPTLEDGNMYVMARVLGKVKAADSLEVELAIFATREKYDSVLTALRAPNASFADAAKASDNPQIVQQEGKLGWITELTGLQMLGSEVRDAAFATAKGQQFTHELTNGLTTLYYIGRVTDATQPVEKAKVAIYATEVTPSSATRRDEYGKLNNFLTEHKSVREMQDSARTNGYNMLTATVYGNSYNIGAVPEARQAVRFAFQEDLGSVSEIYECGDNLLVVVPTARQEQGYRQLKDTTFQKQLRQQVLPEKKVAYLVGEKLAAVSDKSLDGYAKALDTKVDTAQFVNFNLGSITGLGAEPAVIAAALAAQPGQVVGPIAGKNNAVVLQLIAKQGKDLQYDEEARLEAVARSREYAQAANALAVLEQAAEIEDNRITFY